MCHGISAGLNILLLWQINDVKKFVFGPGYDVRALPATNTDLLNHEIEAKVDWIADVTESTVRDLAVSHINVRDLYGDSGGNQVGQMIDSRFHRRLQRIITDELKEYGIGVKKIKVSVGSLPTNVNRASEDLLRISMRPDEADYEAQAVQTFIQRLNPEITSFNNWLQSAFSSAAAWLEKMFKGCSNHPQNAEREDGNLRAN